MPDHLPLSLDPDRTAVREASHDPSATVDVSADSTRPKLPPAPPGLPAVPGYRVTAEIAKGGMGRVFAAIDLTLDREVAIKTLLPGAAPTRFVTESKITAKLPHPGIPPVHALGTLADGRPFLAMKLIHGQTLAEQLKARPTPQHDLPRFVGVFEQVAQAVGFAHSRGVVHRDLKPLNVMAGEFGEVQVMDWGLAKLTTSRDREGAEDADPAPSRSRLPDDLTRAGAVLGTPGYMAPEQARGEPTDARGDVFALGSTLAAVLTGKPAFVGSTVNETIGKAATADLSDVLARLDSCGADAELVALAKRCLAADRDARPADGRVVAGEVAAYRAGVEARLRQAETERAAAVVREGEQRKRRWVWRLAAAVLALGVAGTSLGLWRAEEKRTEADQARQREKDRADGEREAKEAAVRNLTRAERAEAETLADYRAATDDAMERLIGSKPTLGPQERAYLERALTRWQAFADRQGEDEPSRAARSEGHMRVAKVWARLGHSEDARREYETGIRLGEQLVADFPAAAQYRAQLARGLVNLGLVLKDLGRPGAAEECYTKALAAQNPPAAGLPVPVADHMTSAAARDGLGMLLFDLGRPKEAVPHLDRAADLWAALAADFPAEPEYRGNAARVEMNLGKALIDLGRPKEAEQRYRAAMAALEKLAAELPAAPDFRSHLAGCRINLGAVLHGQGRAADAEKLFTQAVAEYEKLTAEFPAVAEHRLRLATAHTNLGSILGRMFRGAAAEEQHAKAIATYEKLAADFPALPDYRFHTANSLVNLGLYLHAVGRAKDAEGRYRQAIAAAEKLAADFPAKPEYRRLLGNARHSLAETLVALGKRGEAEQEYVAAIDMREKLAAVFPAAAENRSDLAASHINLGGLRYNTGKRAAADDHFKQASAILEKLIADAPGTPDYRHRLAAVYTNTGSIRKAAGKPGEAEALFTHAAGEWERLVADAPADLQYRNGLAVTSANLADLVRESGRPADCLDWYQKAIDTLQPILRAAPLNAAVRLTLAKAHTSRALAFEQLGRYAEQAKELDKSLEFCAPQIRTPLRVSRALALFRSGSTIAAVAEVGELVKLTGWSADNLYNFACVYAVAADKVADKRAEYAAAAVEMLQKAVQAGYKDVAHIRADKDLDPLRDRDDFQKLFADLMKKFPPERAVLPPPRRE